MSLEGTKWLCGEIITPTLHIIARAEGWGLQAMPPQPLQTVWLGNSSFWSRNLLTKDSGSPLLDPVHDAGIAGSFFGPKPKELRKADHATRTALFYRALQVTVVYIPFNIHSNHWVYFKIELATNTITLHDPLPPPLQTQVKDTKQFLHRLAEWVIQIKRKRTTNSHLALPTAQAFPVPSEPATSFRTVTSITQKDGFQCAVICIGNIMADASNKPGRVRSRCCESIRKYIGLLLWLNSQRPIALSQEQMSLLAQYSPSGSVIGTGHQSPRFIPGPSASALTHIIIRLMIQEIGDTPPVATVLLLPDLSPEEMSLDPLVSPSCHGDESDSDCQIQQGPEPGSSTALASDEIGQSRDTRPARRGEVETPHPSQIRPWGVLDWPRSLQVGKGLNNLNNTCFCNAVLQCLTHTAPLANFCLDRGHSRRLDSTAATVAYDALLAVERHVIEAFGSSQSSISPIDIVTNLTKIGSHFAAGIQQDAHEFLRSLTANMHLADLSVGGSPHPHTQKHTNLLDGIFGGLLRSQVRCGLCLTDSVRYDTFLDLSLEVHRSVSVDEALRSFADIDVLEGDNKYDCTVCKTKTCATKRLTLHSTPRVLQLHLKRFGVFEEGGSAKIGHHVTFPELLNVQPFTSPDGQYWEIPLDFAL